MKNISKIIITTLAISGLTLTLTAQDAGGPPRRGSAPDRAGREPQPPFIAPVMAALDANGDGTIDAQEMAKASELLKTLDRNNDGQLSADEMRPEMRSMPPGRGPGIAPQDNPSFASITIAKSDAEKKILTVLNDMNQTQRRGSMSVPEQDGRILRLLAESVGAKHVVEIGTSIGYSSIWFCLGLQQTGGKLTTCEIDAGRAAQARQNFKRAGVDQMVTLIEGDAHETAKQIKDPIDVLFLDADKEGYVDYLQKLLPALRPGGIVVAHNINQRMADPRYIKAITTNPDLDTVFLNLQTSGISLTLKKR